MAMANRTVTLQFYETMDAYPFHPLSTQVVNFQAATVRDLIAAIDADLRDERAPQVTMPTDYDYRDTSQICIPRENTELLMSHQLETPDVTVCITKKRLQISYNDFMRYLGPDGPGRDADNRVVRAKLARVRAILADGPDAGDLEPAEGAQLLGKLREFIQQKFDGPPPPRCRGGGKRSRADSEDENELKIQALARAWSNCGEGDIVKMTEAVVKLLREEAASRAAATR